MENTKVKETLREITDSVIKYGKVILSFGLIIINLSARAIVKLSNRAFNKLNKWFERGENYD